MEKNAKRGKQRGFPKLHFFPDFTACVQYYMHFASVFHSYVNVTKILMLHTVFPVTIATSRPLIKAAAMLHHFLNKSRTICST